MNYRRIYSEFIADRRSKEHRLGVFDYHHILPICLGGGDEPDNLIKLSYSDHLFAHALLAFIYGGVLTTTAARMSGMDKYIGRRPRACYQAARKRAVEWLKTRPVSQATRAKFKGNKFKLGFKDTVETRAKKKQSHTPERRKAQSARMKGNTYGLHQSPEMRAKISRVQLRRYARERAEKLWNIG